MSRQRFLCRKKSSVCRDIDAGLNQKALKNCHVGLFSRPFHLGNINTRFFLGFRTMRRWENTSHEVSLYKLPIFLVLLQILIFNRS